MDMTPNDISDFGGGHWDFQDIVEDCAIKGAVAGAGLNDICEE